MFDTHWTKLSEIHKKEDKGMSQEKKIDVRSYDVVFVPFCLLNRGVVAEGLAREYPAIVKPVIMELIDRDMNIVQMPCPELHFSSFEESLKRSPKLKKDYDTPEFRALCRRLGSQTADIVEGFVKADYRVKCILGIEYSPSCAVRLVFRSRTATYSTEGYTVHESGIFFEELKQILTSRGLDIPLVGIHLRGMEKSLGDLKNVLGPPLPEGIHTKLF
jgi:predicted secreted protein